MNFAAYFALLLIVVQSIAQTPPSPTAPSKDSTAVQGTGVIQAKLVGAASAQPLSGVILMVYRQSPAPTVTVRVVSAKDGTFTANALPAGQYSFCIADPTGALLNPCEWRDTQTIVNVADKTTTAATVKVTVASTFKVRINDVASSLAMKTGDKGLPFVSVGVWDQKGGFHPAQETNKDATGIDFRASIPFDSPLRLEVVSPTVKLQTGSNAAVPVQGFAATFQHDSTKTTQPSFTFNATGRNP